MQTQQIIDIQDYIYNLLRNRHLKEAFTQIAKLATEVKEWQYTEELNELENLYRYMVQYMLDGFRDPERRHIYHNLLLSTYSLVDKLTDKLLEKSASTLYYSRHRYTSTLPNYTLERTIERFDAALNTLSVDALLEEQDIAKAKTHNTIKELESDSSEIFAAVWTNYPATSEEYATLERLLTTYHFPWQTLSLIVSAVTLNLMHRYDEQKLQWLLRCYNHSSDEVSQRALCGALLVMYRYRERIKLSKGLTLQLESLKEQPQFNVDARTIFMQLIKSRDTERVTQRFTQELLPEMMKISPTLYKKIEQEELGEIESYLEKNPDWQEILDSSGFNDKMKELSKLQMEGEDLFMGAFAKLKHYPFFSDIANWFLPFCTRHTTLSTLFKGGEEEANFKKLLLKSHFLCNSDKYSFALSLTELPEEQQRMMIAQFNVGGEPFDPIAADEQLLHHSDTREQISNQYIQDLYRFFKLFKAKQEFDDPFTQPLNLYHVEPLCALFKERESLKEIGEYYFRKEYYGEALEFFEELTTHELASGEVYEKIGYCHQMKGEYEAALEAYLKADIITPNNYWVVTHIATCYRNLKMSDMALSYYTKAERIKPDNLSIQLNIGHCHLEQKNYSEALKYYFKVEYLAPSSRKAWRPIAWCSFLEGKYEQSMRYYTQILAQQPSAMDYMNAAHVQLAMGEVHSALDNYKRSIDMEGDKDTFIHNFEQDIPSLKAAGVASTDIPIVLDLLMYGLS